VVENRSVFWWGGNGISTEHTAFLNLKKGIKAPRSGSIETNGKTVAEQIGAQIFIDGWAMICPGNPALAAQLAEKAGKVSHDGESVYAAMVWAAMEAEAFVSKDVDHLLDTGLSLIPVDSLIHRMITEVRNWACKGSSWLDVRQLIETKYGYHKFCGNCHVIPNHAIMTLAFVYGGNDFQEAMHIINTCGWDTDCNSGNIGCLVALMHGLDAFEGEPDWRTPIADQALISSADSGYSINNAARIAYDLTNIGRQLAGDKPLDAPKDGAQFHFTLPGSVQGFKRIDTILAARKVEVKQDVDPETGNTGLAVHLQDLWPSNTSQVVILTPSFTPPDIVKMRESYELMASPLVYPGQTVKALVRSSSHTTGEVTVSLHVKGYNADDDLTTSPLPMPSISLQPGDTQVLQWKLPQLFEGPIQQLGIAIKAAGSEAVTGTVSLNYLRWDGTPELILRRPQAGGRGKDKFWREAWVNGFSKWQPWGPSFYLAQNEGEGFLGYGTREWRDYRVVVSEFKINLGNPTGVAVRVQGLRRWYAFQFLPGGGRVGLVRAMDDRRDVLASTEFNWELDRAYRVVVQVVGDRIQAGVDDRGVLDAVDGSWSCGGIGLVLNNGCISAQEIQVGPADVLEGGRS
jgi:hypothetical protein